MKPLTLIVGLGLAATGLASAGQVVEVFASETTGTWTITVTRPDGTACLVATGEHFGRPGDAPDAAKRGDPV